MEEIVQRIKPFAKDVYIFQALRLAKKEFGKTIFGNTMLLGAATGAELIPLKVQSLRKAIEVTAPRGLEENLKAFEFGLKLGKEYKI
jgi:Pyruvate/2-oxoacid:ferredoxin oxidoreductase gamma subunit